MATARKGKIARLPVALREELNRRLLDGEPASRLLPWLNELPEVLRVLDAYFAEEPVTPQNLSEWRQGGYQDWLGRRERLEDTKALAGFASSLAQRGEGLGGGNVAIVGGQLLEIFETLDVDAQKRLLAEKPESYIALVECLAKLEKSQADRLKASAGAEMVEIQRERTKQAEGKLQLERQRFARQTAELFLKFYEDKRAKEIVDTKGPRAGQIEKLRQLMFPELEPLDPTPLNADREG